MPAPALARTLRVDVMTAEVFDAFGARAIDAVILKGVAIARELYEFEGDRTYADCDILVADETRAAAETALTELGFMAPGFIAGSRPSGDGTLHDLRAEHWVRKADGGEIDLHRTLFGLRASPRAVWAALSLRTRQIVVAGQPVRVLDRGALALVVAIHAVQHRGELAHPSADLARAVDRWELEVWREAWALAELVDGVDLLAAGLGAIPSGAAVAGRLGLIVSGRRCRRAVTQAFREERLPWHLAHLDTVAAAPGARGTAAATARLLLPRPKELRRLDPRLTDAVGWPLAAAYGRRLLRLVRGLPALAAARRPRR